MFLTIIAWLLGIVSLLALAFLLFWRLWFLRQPARTIPRDGVVSPADGKITRIIAFSKGKAQHVPKGLLGAVHTFTHDVAQEGYMIVIMLTPLNVHYQRAPISGKVVSIRYTPGKFRNVVLGDNNLGAFENEKNEIVFASPTMRVKVVQVAGFAARRIVCMADQHAQVKKGSVIGLINLGSQVLLVLPKCNLAVHEGQQVIDGETVIAR